MYEKIVGVLCILLFTIHIGYAQTPVAEKIELQNSKLTNLYRVDADVYRSEQPGSEDFRKLEELGVKEVLNLRRKHKDDKKAQNTSLVLHRVKMNALALKEEQLVEALRIIKNRQGPILVHCKHGADRAGGVIAMYRIVFQGVDKEVAIEEMTKGGFNYHKMCRNIVRTIRNADIEAIRATLEE